MGERIIATVKDTAAWLGGEAPPIEWRIPAMKQMVEEDQESLQRAFRIMGESKVDNLPDAAALLIVALRHSDNTRTRLEQLRTNALHTGDDHLLLVMMTELAKYAFPEKG